MWESDATIHLTTAQTNTHKEECLVSKKVARVVKLQFPAGGAKPGPALAGVGINMPILYCVQ